MPKTFKKGQHVPERKHATEGLANKLVPPPKQVVIPINQHFGAPNRCLVSPGDVVKRGQKIAEGAAPGPMTVPVHASISGVVKKVEPRTQSSNIDGLCVVIEAQEAAAAGAAAEDDFLPPLDPFACTKEEALARVREAGLVGMGGAGFPMYLKLSPQKPVDTLIANAAECEPYLTTDEALLRERPGLLVQGIVMAMRITGIRRGVIGVEDNKRETVPGLQDAIRKEGRGLDIGVELVRTKYPQGGEKMLITALTGREVPSGGLPMDAGCIVQNVGTLAAMAEAFTLGKPLIERSLTVTGGACKTPKNIIAPIGTLLSDLPIEIDGGSLAKILFGGPMMGVAVPSTAIPIQKNTSGIVLMTAAETARFGEDVCIRCGRCAANCPMRLSPVLMNIALETGEMAEAQKAGLLDCIECGCCSYICPGRIKLVQRFRVGKQQYRAWLAAQPKPKTEGPKEGK
jgi:electron transport complex protein RnfC